MRQSARARRPWDGLFDLPSTLLTAVGHVINLPTWDGLN